MCDVVNRGVVLTGALRSATTRLGLSRGMSVITITCGARLCSGGSSISRGGGGGEIRHHVPPFGHHLFDTQAHLLTLSLWQTRLRSSNSSIAHDVWSQQSLPRANTNEYSLAYNNSATPRRRLRSRRWRYAVVRRRWSAASSCLEQQQGELTSSQTAPAAVSCASEAQDGVSGGDDWRDNETKMTTGGTVEVQGSSNTTTASDPLLAFLQQHHEDGAVMLAMWSSLYRCCLFASEVTEGLALRVRYVFHLLLRHRAVAAAMRLYERLQQIGVELRQNDLLLLLTSLPYEHSAARSSAEATLRRAQGWIDEAADEQRSRAGRARRMAAQREAEAATHARHAALRSRADVTAQARPVAAQSSYLSPVNATGSIVERHPTWVRNWVLYELSMGNLNLDDDDDDDVKSAEPLCEDRSDVGSAAVQFTQAEGERATNAAVASTKVAVTQVCDDLLCQMSSDVRGSTALDTATETRKQRVLLAMLEHLYVLQRQLSGGQARQAQESTTATNRAGGARRWRRAMHKASSPRPARLLRSTLNPRRYSERDRICREALRLVHLYVRERSRDGTTRLARAAVTCTERAVSVEVTNVVHDLVRASAMNTTAAASLLGAMYARVMQHEAHAFAFRDLVLLFRLCAEARPWATSVTFEQLVSEELLPLVDEGTAAGLAVQALWLSHLCLVKASGAEQFFVQLQHIQRLWAMPALQQGDLATLVWHAVAKARLASSHLLVEVRRWGRVRRDEALLAASLRSGVYVPPLDATAADAGETRVVPDQPALANVPATAPLPSSSVLIEDGRWWGRPGSDALLPPGLIDAFVICTEAVLDALAMATLLSVRHDTVSASDTTTLAALHSLLESAVLGPFGLWSVFSTVYIAHGGSGDDNDDRSSERALRRAPERACLAFTLLRFMVRALRLLCRWAAEPNVRHRRGANTGFTASQTRRVLEVACAALRAALPLAATTCAAREDVEVAAERVAVDVAALCKPLLLFLRLYDSVDERAMFGAVQSDVMVTVGLYGKLLTLVDDVTRASRVCDDAGDADGGMTQGQDTRQSSLRSPSRLWQPVFARLTLRGRRAMRFCFDPSHNLGSHVRRQLGQRELRRLDAMLRRRQRRGGALCSGSAVIRLAASDEMSSTLDHALSMRAELYAAMLAGHGAGQEVQPEARCNEALDTVARSLASRCTWRESCVLMQLLAADLRPARRSLSVRFFADVITAMRRGLPQQHDLAPVHRRLWLDAIGVYWHAVDHTASHAVRDTAQHGEEKQGGPTRPGAAHERAVLAACLLSLCDLSNAVGRRDVGRQWRRAWAAMYSVSERREPTWAAHNIAALAALHDRRALQACVELYARTAAQSSSTRHATVAQLLCDVSVRHADWRQAIDALQASFGPVERHVQHSTRYSVPVVQALLVLLSRSSTNLSNTALRLRTLQQDVWDAGAALTLVRMLLRARRWRLALQQVQEALRLPDMQHIETTLRDVHGTTDITTEVAQDAGAYHSSRAARCDDKTSSEGGFALTSTTLQYASLLVCGLQACAIGSQGETAGLLYDAFKAVLHCAGGGNGGDDAVNDAGVCGGGDARRRVDDIDALLATPPTLMQRFGDGGHDDDVVPQLQRQLQEHATRARAFFFRAITKKLK